MALIEGNTLSFMFEGVRRGDEDKLKALLNEKGEVTLKLLRHENPNLFRAIFHFGLVKKFIPQEATPDEPPADWAVHGEIPALIVEKEVPDVLKVKAFDTVEEALAPEVKIDWNEGEEPELDTEPGAEIIYNGYNQRVEDPVDSADDLLIVEGDELVGETEAVKFPDKEEEIVVEKLDAPVTVKSTKAKKAK